MFAKEKDMIEIVKDWLRPQVTAMETELYCGFAGEFVPDVVGICFDVKKASQSKRITPLARGRVRKLLAENRVPQTYHTDLIAIELKLTRFTQAFFQAIVYRSFGFRTYIAMPDRVYFNLKKTQRKAICAAGVGFLSVAKDACVVMAEAKSPVTFDLDEEILIADRLICRFKSEN